MTIFINLHAASLPGLEIPVAVAVLGWSLFHDKYVWSPSLLYDRFCQPGQPLYRKSGSTYRGLIRWVTVNNVPRTMQMPPTATYAIPRKGFFPPMTVRVDMTKDLVPPYTSTGKSRIRLSVCTNSFRQSTYYCEYPPGTYCTAWSRCRCASPAY